VYWREKNLTGYTVQETYSLYRRGDDSPSAQMVVQTTYAAAAGKTYHVLSQSGSSTGKLVLHRILKSEEQLTKPGEREHLLITSANYEMSVPDLQPHELHGRKCFIVTIKPLRSSPYLLAGRIWVDADSYHVIRVEGAPTSESSMWAGHSTVERDYVDVDTVPVAVHTKSTSRNALLGESTLNVKYENYRLSVSAPATASQP
jgi:hypothetical protein